MGIRGNAPSGILPREPYVLLASFDPVQIDISATDKGPRSAKRKIESARPDHGRKSHDGQRAAIRSDDWKLVIDRRNKTSELFDMKNDPQEKQNLAAKHPDRVRELTALLEKQAKLDSE